jgi:hypothetical protein
MSKQTSNKFSPEVRSRAVRLVLDHGQHMRAACSMRWSRPSMIGGRSIAVMQIALSQLPNGSEFVAVVIRQV